MFLKPAIVKSCLIRIPLIVFQTLKNVTVPGPENCTSPVLCWFDGNNTITLKNVSETYNIKKCKNQMCNWSVQNILSTDCFDCYVPCLFVKAITFLWT